ncbi:MAG TPA: SurA N-terminal domain-containing protein [Acidiphilium sp.]
MLSSIRKLLDNWIARAFFTALAAVFVFWGVSNIVTTPGSGGAVATVGGHAIQASAISRGYQQKITAYAEKHDGHEPSQGVRRLYAGSVLGDMIDQETMALDAKRLGVVAPPEALRQQIFSMPVFNGPDGKFDKTTFNQVLAAHQLSPDLFMADIARSLNADQIIQAITTGVVAPKPLTGQIFSYIGQKRTIQYVQLPFAAATAPSPPADAVLRRYWRNHPERFSSPTMRKIRVVILSPALIAPDQPVSQSEIAAQYDSEKSSFGTTATRTVEIITAEDAKSAASLAAEWQKGADWTAIQKAAAAVSATAVTFTDATRGQFPSGRLAKAVFAAKQGEVSAPVTGALGTYVFKVTKATPGGAAPLSAVTAKVKAQVQLGKARDVVDQNVTKLQDALAGDTPLSKLPGNLHLVAVEGKLDAQGMTDDGKPAPIPGPTDLRKAIVAAAFATPQGAQPQVKSGPGDSYYAVSVEQVIPPALKPYEKVKAQVLAGWTEDQVRRQQEVAAAKLLTEVKGGKTLATAASAVGETVVTSQPMTRSAPDAGVPPKLLPIIFTLKQGEPTMVETEQEFIVATVTAIAEPKPGSDPATMSHLQAGLDQAMQTSVLQAYATALRNRYHVSINAKALHQISD